MPGASFLLADMDTGQILVARAPHAPHLPASTMTMLTALTLIPLLNPNTSIRVKQEDVNVDGTHVGILPGTAYNVGTLMQGMLMASGNDAADALARGNQGMAVTVQEMNATATDLGASDTVARDPSGLDKADQHSSAYDLALIGRDAMMLPNFRGYVMTRQTVFPGGRSADGKLIPGFTISNHNTLLFNYRGAIGVKNGYTVAAKFTYVEAATRGGKTYLLSEMASPIGTWRPAAAMLDWAFAHGPSLTPIGALVDPGEPAVTSRPWLSSDNPIRRPPLPRANRLASLRSLTGSAWPGGSAHWPWSAAGHGATSPTSAAELAFNLCRDGSSTECCGPALPWRPLRPRPSRHQT
jgi:D-alanyl-D-alanine carboxypeptidase (penicillin-binding protein 5/6)